MTAVFDNQWNLTASNCVDDVTILGNGKIGLISGSRSNVISKVYISSFVNEQTQNNMIEIFNTHSISLSNYNVNTTSNFIQTLNMYCGILTSSTIYSGNNLPDLLVTTDVYAAQHLPFCTIQTVNVNYAYSNITQSNQSVDMFHTINANNLSKPRFNNSTIFNQLNDNGIYILTGEANINDENIVTACTYSFSSSNINKGFNISCCDTQSAFNIFKIPVPSSFSIVTSHMTKHDFFQNPLEEVKRIVLRVLNEGVSKTRTKHVSAWSDQWANTNLSIQQKSGITASEQSKISLYNRNIKYSLYNIFSCTRKNEDGNSFGIINIPLSCPTESLLYTGDLFLIPVLLLLCPDNAKSFLTYRHKTLSQAKQFAVGYGFYGAKYPYYGETTGYNALYWNTYSQFTIFNTALVSINIWNFYRSKLDKAWLQNVGFPVLQENAEFFISCINYDSNTGTYSIQNTVGLSGIVSESNNIFTNNTVKLALRFAIEAGYELSAGCNCKWDEYFYGLPMLTYQKCHCPDGVGSVYKFDSTYSLSTSASIPIAEPLLLFVPYYQTPNNGQFSNISVSGIPQNIALISTLNSYYSRVMDWENPINAMILALSYAIYSQTTVTYLSEFTSAFDNFISSQTSRVWGNMSDITVYSLFLIIMLQGLIGLKIYGGVAESRFYYEEIKTTSNIYANMPKTWKSVALIRSKKYNATTNQCTYP